MMPAIGKQRLENEDDSDVGNEHLETVDDEYQTVQQNAEPGGFWQEQFGGCQDQWTVRHFVVFILTFVSYGFFHASRKTFSNVKTSLSDVWTAQKDFNGSGIYPNQTWASDKPLFDSPEAASYFLGDLDAIFMGSYAAGLYISGWIGDRTDPRYVLTFGMFGSGITLILFGCVTEWFHFYSVPYYVIMWILFGLTQACGWPTEVAIMSKWFGKGRRGLILGIWSSCQSVGNIAGAALASQVLVYGYEYCLSNACLKLTNYAFFFWLPFYLQGRFGWDEKESDQISIWYDVGAIFGSIPGGLISDLMGCRTPIVVLMLTGSLGALYGYSATPKNLLANEVLMTVVGALVGGPYNLIAATVAADLGTQPQLAGNTAALSTVTGLIDGSGSVGSAVGQIVVPYIENIGGDGSGWNYVFYLFIVMNGLAIICLIPRLIHDLRTRYQLCQPSEEETSLLDNQ